MLRSFSFILKRFYCEQTKVAEISTHLSKVPQQPFKSKIFTNNDSKIEIDSELIQLLERISLVDLEHKEAYKTLHDSIVFANSITSIDTNNIQPLYTVLEDQQLDLREDIICEGKIRDDIMKNAKVTEEDYFVAPPGNIPLETKEKKFD